MTQLFHFTLGPVQDFVAQARRTRDLWAGSFLLSWLAAQAMVEVRQGGVIVFPVVADEGGPTDPLIAAIEGKPLEKDPRPQIGSLPNRFKATVPDNFDAKEVETRVQSAWVRLADAVWKQFIEPVADQGLGTRTIWDRQVAGFWEISWVLGEAQGDHSDARWLEARKNWRNHWPEPEGGDHCALMGDLQELSGYNRALERDQQDKFWKSLRAGTGHLELHDHERLCAIALIKRLFPRLDKPALLGSIGWVPGGKSEVIGNWPSTAYMAVIPWLREFVGDDTRMEALQRYEDEVVKAAGTAVHGERSSHIFSLKSLDDLAWLDGNFFLPNALKNAADTPLLPEREDQREPLVKSLRDLQEDHPSQPYYALLLLDGDSLGEHLSKGDPGKISVSLAKFSQGVADIVARHDGVTLYAGGDDVLALLSMDRALACASALNTAYGRAFDDPAFTVSVAIVFAHYHLPLREVLAEAHRQLDKVAKEANGRDSLALAWFKASGKVAQWVATWTNAEGDKPGCDLQSLATAVREGAFGSGFFYKLKTRYPMLDQNEKQLSVQANVEPMLQAEYLKSREPKPTLEQAEQAVCTLLHACRLSQRDAQGAFKATAGKLQLDGLRLARLLAGKEARE
jgi:CRISPR-associated protein Cmr2